jgi:hypothetical protein
MRNFVYKLIKLSKVICLSLINYDNGFDEMVSKRNLLSDSHKNKYSFIAIIFMQIKPFFGAIPLPAIASHFL